MELRENAARPGERLQVFGAANDYFAALFEMGVMSLQLVTDEERNKLNEMLRTSMPGGISRALTSEPRFFLLKGGRRARSLLGISELRTDKRVVHFSQYRARLAEVDLERRDGAQRLTDASTHREDTGRVADAHRRRTR